MSEKSMFFNSTDEMLGNILRQILQIVCREYVPVEF